MAIIRTVTRVGAAVAAVGAFLAFWRKRRSAGPGGRGWRDGGGLAGDREPRNPVPPTLVDAGAGTPQD
jgi:hypothetical protein